MTASANFPVVSPYDATLGGTTDAVVAVLSSDLTTLLYSTYLGGAGAEYLADLVADAADHIYAGGWTTSADFPLLKYFDSTIVGFEGFVTRLDPASDTLVYSTLLGGSGSDQVTALAVSSADAVLIAGLTSSTDLPVPAAWDPSFNGGSSDAFFMKMDGVDTTCCIGIRGNLDDNGGDLPNVSDLSFLVEFLFNAGRSPLCRAEGNVNGSAGDEINVSDVSYMVNYLFKAGPSPAPCP
jgi:hypothetical protein